jgi:neutral ceramidase
VAQKNPIFLAGAAETVITPLPGSPTLGTIQRSTGVHDDLHARALVLNDGRQRIAILSLDLIGTDFILSDQIREAILKRTGIAFTLVHCTHNHSAPFTIPWSVLGSRWLVGPGKSWRDGLPIRLAELASQAEGKSETATLRAGRTPVHIGTNRRLPSEQGIVMKPNPDGPRVPWVDVLRVDRLDGSPLAVLFSHAAHPVIIHGSSREISAEFPGFATLKLKERFGGDVVTMFGQAFAGNINGDPLRGGMAAAEHAGKVLAEAAFQAASKSVALPSGEFRLSSIHSEIPLQPLPAREDCTRLLREAEELLAKRYGEASFSDEQLWDMQDEAETAKSQNESKAADDVQPMEGKAWWMVDTVLCLRDLLKKIDDRDERQLRFDAHLIRIGDSWSLLAASHELFAEYQLLLDDAAPAEHNMMLSYTNGCESYIPMDRDLALGGYEAASFPDDGAALRYRHRRALQFGFEKPLIEQLRSLWS